MERFLFFSLKKIFCYFYQCASQPVTKKPGSAATSGAGGAGKKGGKPKGKEKGAGKADVASEPLLSVSRVYCEDKTSFSYAHYFSFHHFTLPCIPLKQNSVTQSLYRLIIVLIMKVFCLCVYMYVLVNACVHECIHCI